MEEGSEITELDLNYFCKHGGAKWVRDNAKQIYKEEFKVHVDNWLENKEVSDGLLTLYMQDHISSIFSDGEVMVATYTYEDRLIVGTYIPNEDHQGYVEDLIYVKIVKK